MTKGLQKDDHKIEQYLVLVLASFPEPGLESNDGPSPKVGLPRVKERRTPPRSRPDSLLLLLLLLWLLDCSL